MAEAMAAARTAMRRLYRAPEREILPELAREAALAGPDATRVRQRAGRLIEDLRDQGRSNWAARFLREYGLNTDEGVALLGLAEAYLRVPDAYTADALIQDKIGEGDWGDHLGGAGSLVVDAATLGLVMAKGLAAPGAGPLRAVVGRIGQPAVRAAVSAAISALGEQFVLGRDIAEGLRRAGRQAPFRHSFDMLGEGARTRADAEAYAQRYLDAIAAVAAAQSGGGDLFDRDTISVKLSALHPRYEPLQAARAVPELTAILVELCRVAKAADLALTVDAEEAERLEMSLDIIAAAAAEPSLRGWDGLGLAVQAYQRRARAVVDWTEALAQATGRRICVRLVKGAYWDSEIKRAQEEGLASYPVFTRKASTDVSYLACARRMLAARRLYPAFATHNAMTAATLMEWAGARRDFEFQRLHGMGEGLYERPMAEAGFKARIYAPIGGHRDLLAYLVRRLLENGANNSFVNQLADRQMDEGRLLADPVEAVAAAGFSPHPQLPEPKDIFPDRRNSQGLDLSDSEAVSAALRLAQATTDLDALSLAPAETAPEAADGLLARAQQAQPAWAAAGVEARAAVLERAAELIEADRERLIALMVREAGKTLADAVGEIREAVDFCRYYAVQARRELAPLPLPGPAGEANELRLEGRGVFVCISPWNFPLSIFTGQVAAALAAGDAVAAKPAPQTPRIAAEAVRLLHQAGAPKAVLQLAAGGPAVGEALVASRRCAGVAFTGSTATARRIARTLLEDERRPLAPLIAETGGVNAMIVDSSALPEQVVADVTTSAFRSAGQRCSALRLLCLQAEIAEPVLRMLIGAMDELRVGDPGDPATDVGPVIDPEAKARLEAHVARCGERVLHRCAAPAGGLFVAPTLIRLDKVEDLTEEVFGPVLHVVTWRGPELRELVERINGSGFGLTLGLHSRLAHVADEVRGAARVGNLYVNRSMIGAVVGVQPFGGEGLSGTGPKAGGPHYLARFAVERTVTVNLAAAGGDPRLLSLED